MDTSADSGLGCKPCPEGTFGVDNATSILDCELCPPGTFSSASWALSLDCEPCPLGSYGENAGASSVLFCHLCPVGTYGDQLGAWSESMGCSSCPSPSDNSTKSLFLGATNLGHCFAATRMVNGVLVAVVSSSEPSPSPPASTISTAIIAGAVGGGLALVAASVGILLLARSWGKRKNPQISSGQTLRALTPSGDRRTGFTDDVERIPITVSKRFATVSIDVDPEAPVANPHSNVDLPEEENMRPSPHRQVPLHTTFNPRKMLPPLNHVPRCPLPQGMSAGLPISEAEHNFREAGWSRVEPEFDRGSRQQSLAARPISRPSAALSDKADTEGDKLGAKVEEKMTHAIGGIERGGTFSTRRTRWGESKIQDVEIDD